MNKDADALSRLDSRANVSHTVDEKVPTMTFSTTPGPSQNDFVHDDEDLLPTGEYITDIDALGFAPGIS